MQKIVPRFMYAILWPSASPPLMHVCFLQAVRKIHVVYAPVWLTFWRSCIISHFWWGGQGQGSRPCFKRARLRLTGKWSLNVGLELGVELDGCSELVYVNSSLIPSGFLGWVPAWTSQCQIRSNPRTRVTEYADFGRTQPNIGCM